MGCVALVGDRLVVDALQFTGPPLDGPLDGVEGYRRVPGLLEHGPQSRIGVGVAAALSSRHLNLLDELREELATLGVRGSLFVLDGRPLGMARHIALRLVSSMASIGIPTGIPVSRRTPCPETVRGSVHPRTSPGERMPPPPPPGGTTRAGRRRWPAPRPHHPPSRPLGPE